MDMGKEKPVFDEVYAYALKSVSHYVRKLAFQLPLEQKEEIQQNALMRAWQSYAALDPNKGWKSFIQLHCRGAVLDYLKGGDRDTESELGLERCEIVTDKGRNAVLDVDEVVGLMGMAGEEEVPTTEAITPNWDLLGRMASKDENLHIVCKVLQGFSQESIASQFISSAGQRLSRERVSQRIYEFFARLDSPDYLTDEWVNQCIFALGLCDIYRQPEYDNGVGWSLPYFNMSDVKSFEQVRVTFTPNLFDFSNQQNSEMAV